MIDSYTMFARGYLAPYALQHSLPAHPHLVVTAGSGSVYQNVGAGVDHLLGATIVTDGAPDETDPDAQPLSAPHTVLFDWSVPDDAG